MPRKNHTHKYIKRQTSSAPVWACSLPDCNHFMPSHLTGLVEGRSSYCWSCDDKFTLDSNSMLDDQPKCPNCRGSIKDISSILGLEVN